MQMLERNVTVKNHPERWQDNRDVFDVALTFDERVMEQLVEGWTHGHLAIIELGKSITHSAGLRLYDSTPGSQYNSILTVELLVGIWWEYDCLSHGKLTCILQPCISTGDCSTDDNICRRHVTAGADNNEAIVGSKHCKILAQKPCTLRNACV